MRIARICDPASGNPYPNFCHNTTTYVAVPHGALSQLFAFDDEEPAIASIQVDGREVHSVRLDGRQIFVELHKLTAPEPHEDSFTDTLAYMFRMRRRPSAKNITRLYAFRVVLQADNPRRGVLATYDFHILCPPEYAEAQLVHRQLILQPNAIAPDTISDRTEGRRCPECAQTRVDRTLR